MMIKLVFLGKLRALASADLAAALPPEVNTLGGLKAWIATRDPLLHSALASTLLALNREIVRDMALGIGDGDEVAFLPPMSGG